MKSVSEMQHSVVRSLTWLYRAPLRAIRAILMFPVRLALTLYRGVVFVLSIPFRAARGLWFAAIWLVNLPARLWKSIAGRRFNRDEREFLPAALEVLETPPNPIGQTFGVIIVALFTIGAAWAYFGEMDVVATGRGQLVPVGGVKVIKPLEAGVVREIAVRNGQKVEAGELLIRLDPTESEVDTGQMQRRLSKEESETARLRAFLDYIDWRTEADGAPDYPRTADNRKMSLEARLRLRSDIVAFEDELVAADKEIDFRKMEIDRIQNTIDKLEVTIPLIAEREAALSELVKQAFSPRPVWLQVVERHVEAQHELKIARKSKVQSRIAVEAATAARERTVSRMRQNVVAQLNQSRDRYREADLYLKKAKKRLERSRLMSPVAGTIQQLAINTIGGVVSAAEPLLVVVPKNADLEVTVQILNKDIGFVAVGDTVTVKIDSFPFTKYGHIEGIVADISKNAVNVENAGLVYNARVELLQTSIAVENTRVDLIPGMAVTADFQIGKRRLLEFVLSPLLRYRDESMRER